MPNSVCGVTALQAGLKGNTPHALLLHCVRAGSLCGEWARPRDTK